jgi:lipopolysaccharide transport system ATP-binding protein
VQFADIGDFLEQPVKTYSSGMLVRLAFAVIAHVDADILVIDEALAVGDAVFTQKCMRFLRGFMKNGTVLFVSHDTGSVSNLCDSVVWLNQGRVQEIGATSQVLKAYSLFVQQEILGDQQKFEAIEQVPPEATNEPNRGAAAPDVATKLAFFEQINESSGWKTQLAEITAARLTLHSGEVAAHFQGGERVRLDIEALCHSPLASPILGWFLKDRLGQPLFGEHTYTHVEPLACVAGERLRASFVFRLPLLPNGSYTMTVSIADGDPWNHTQHHWLHEAFVVQVNSTVLRYGLVGIPFEQVKMEKFE